jgi:hypothetical protein
MIFGKKSPKLLLIATTLTIIALALVLVVYAVTIGTYTGGSVTVSGVTTGTLTYSIDNTVGGTWSTDIQPSGSWYAKLSVNHYQGPVTITWQLQSYGTGSWVDVSGKTVSTTITLSGSAQEVYASPTGVNTGNHDWSTDITVGGTYRVYATVASA